MRILFVNYCIIGEDSATGTTLQNLFTDLKDVEILQYSLDTSLEIDNSKLRGIKTVKNKKSTFLNDQIQKKHHQKIKQQSLAVPMRDKASVKSRMKQFGKRFLLTLNELLPQKISKEVLVEIDGFSPEIIYTLGGDLNVLKQALYFSKRYSAPIVLHNMDDLYNTRFVNGGILESIAKKKLLKCYKEVYAHSCKSVAIGPKMAKEYEKEFGIPFAYAMNCLEQPFDGTNACFVDQPLLIYSGGMHGGRSDTLLALANAIEKNDADVCFEIFTSDRDFARYQAVFAEFQKTKLYQFVPKSEQMANLARASALVHVESFAEEYKVYFRLSMSTKIAEYAAVERPILCIGPVGIATVDFIKDKNIGIAIDTIDHLSECLDTLLDERHGATMCENIHQVFADHFYAPTVRQKLIEVFRYNLENYRR